MKLFYLCFISCIVMSVWSYTSLHTSLPGLEATLEVILSEWSKYLAILFIHKKLKKTVAVSSALKELLWLGID
jgi:hypothetical protein